MKDQLKQLADEISNMSLQERLVLACQSMDSGRFDIAQMIIKTVSDELSWYVDYGKKIISNGGLRTFRAKSERMR